MYASGQFHLDGIFHIAQVAGGLLTVLNMVFHRLEFQIKCSPFVNGRVVSVRDKLDPCSYLLYLNNVFDVCKGFHTLHKSELISFKGRIEIIRYTVTCMNENVYVTKTEEPDCNWITGKSLFCQQ